MARDWPARTLLGGRYRWQSDVVRFQGGALQQWNEVVPWAPAGDVTAVNIGEIAAALGLFPPEATAPAAVPPPAPIGTTTAPV